MLAFSHIVGTIGWFSQRGLPWVQPRFLGESQKSQSSLGSRLSKKLNIGEFSND